VALSPEASSEVLLEPRVTVEPVSTRFDPSDERWARQVDELRRDLLTEVPQARLAETSSAGMKGSVTTLIMALGSAGVVAAMVECLRLWLGRDRTRKIVLRLTDGEREETLTLEGEGVNASGWDAAVAETIRAFADNFFRGRENGQ